MDIVEGFSGRTLRYAYFYQTTSSNPDSVLLLSNNHLQTGERHTMLKVTFHENLKIDFDMFHIRVRGTDVELKAFLDVMQASVDAGYCT